MSPKLPLFLSIPIILALAVTVTGTYLHGFSGVDIWFHLDIAKEFASGNLVGAFNVAYGVDHTFYPPLFHFLLAPGYWLGNAQLWALGFQIALLPLAVGSFMFLVYKLRGETSAFYGGLLLLGSMAYLDRVIQAQPHAVDLLLLPVAMYFCLTKRGRGYVAASVLMVWNHGIVSISALGGTLLALLKQKNWRVIIVWLACIFVVLALSLYFLVSGLQGYGAAVDTDQEYLFWHSPTFMFEYLGLLSVGLLVAGYVMARLILGLPVSAISKLSLLTVLTTAVMVPVWAERWLQYSTIPLALLILEQAHTSGPQVQTLLKIAIVLSVVLTIGGLLF